MSILAWIIFGIAVGIIANSIDRKPAYGGVIGAMFLGVVGAMIGGILSAVASGGFAGLNLNSVLVVIAGSLLFLLLGKSIRSA